MTWFFLSIMTCVFVIIIVLDCYNLSCEKEGSPGLTAMWITVLGLIVEFSLSVLFQMTTFFGSLYWIWDHPWNVIVSLATYFGIGVLYSIVWFPSLIRARYKRLCELRSTWEKGEKLQTFDVFAKNHGAYCIKTGKEVPDFFEYRAAVGRRISWWWAYIINWCISDLVINLWRMITNFGSWIASLLRAIYDSIARSVVKRLKTNP